MESWRRCTAAFWLLMHMLLLPGGGGGAEHAPMRAAAAVLLLTCLPRRHPHPQKNPSKNTAAIRFVLNDAFVSMRAEERQALLHVRERGAPWPLLPCNCRWLFAPAAWARSRLERHAHAKTNNTHQPHHINTSLSLCMTHDHDDGEWRAGGRRPRRHVGVRRARVRQQRRALPGAVWGGGMLWGCPSVFAHLAPCALPFQQRHQQQHQTSTPSSSPLSLPSSSI